MESQINITDSRPSPTDFDRFLPWACLQMSVESLIVITRRMQSNYVSVSASGKSKLKSTKSKRVLAVESSNVILEENIVSSMGTIEPDSKIDVETIYDACLNLVQLKFLKNKTIPRLVFKIIALIIPFHQYLTSITINSGLNMEAIYEISKFLHLSHITELIFDGTFLVEANYHILLDQSSLKHLSVSKCKINDAVVETIACKLVVPCPAAKTLSVLNLATNRITDQGVKYLADALRSNRQLSYLNLADNLITDRGAISLLNTLVDFRLNTQELKERKDSRYMIYLKMKTELVFKTVKEIRDGEFDKKVTKKTKIQTKTPVPPPSKKNKSITTDTAVKIADNTSLINVKAIHYERAEAIVREKLGPFQDPFDSNSTLTRDGEVYCLGNNSLCYLNLAYNNLTYISLKKLHEVLLKQRIHNRIPTGLINVKIDGNYLPEVCEELLEIDDLLESGFSCRGRMGPTVKKKRTSKTGIK